MRKGFKLLPMVLVVLMLTTTVFAEPIKVLVENKPLVMDVIPIAQNGRTLVPIRAIFEALGAKVEWEPSTKTITGIQENKVIILQIDNKIATINGEKVELDVPATAVNGRTLVPVRFIGESLGAKVEWHNPTQTVLVNSTLEEVQTYKVTRVVDGDTIIVSFNGKEERVRLIEIEEEKEEIKPEVKTQEPQKNVNDSLVVYAGEDTRLTMIGLLGYNILYLFTIPLVQVKLKA